MNSFSAISKAAILVAIYIVLCLQNKTFAEKVQKHSGSSNHCGKCTKNLAALLRIFFSNTYLTYFSGTMLLSTVLKRVKFILSLFFSIFKYRIFMFFLFLTYLHLILYKNNSSVSRDFLPRHVNRHSKQSIYETNIFDIFNDIKKFLTIFNSSVDYNFVFSHSFKFYANFDDNLVIPECILTLYTELITVLFKLRNVFFDNFDYQRLWKTIVLMVCFNSFILSRQIYRIFLVLFLLNLAQKNSSSSIY